MELVVGRVVVVLDGADRLVESGIADEELLARIERRADEHMASKVAQWGADVMRYVEK